MPNRHYSLRPFAWMSGVGVRVRVCCRPILLLPLLLCVIYVKRGPLLSLHLCLYPYIIAKFLWRSGRGWSSAGSISSTRGWRSIHESSAFRARSKPMNNQRVLDVVEARAIIGLPEVEGASPSIPDLSRPDENRPSPSCDTSVPPSIREFGGTLKSRFAAIARQKGNDRKDTRHPSRSLVGRRANLEGSLEKGRAPGGVSGVEKGARSLPIQR